MSSDLQELASRLRASGTTVVRHKDYFEIRLALFASVRVSIIDGQLHCEPRFGFIPRDRATWLTLIVMTAVTAAFLLDMGLTPLSLLIGFVSLMSSASTGIRYMLTESCITRVQTAFMLMRTEASGALGAGEAHGQLGEADPVRSQRFGARAEPERR